MFQHVLHSKCMQPSARVYWSQICLDVTTPILTSLSYCTGTRFRLLLLALQHCRQTQQHQRYQHGQICPPHIAVLFERIMATALQAFRAPPAWYGKWHKNQAR